MQIINRKEAKQLGLKRYFTGKACVHGHISERFTNDGKCRECSRISPSREKFRDRDAKKRKEKRLAYRLMNPIYRKSEEQKRIDAIANAKKWREENRDRANELQRIGYARDPERKKASKRKWYTKNASYRSALTAKRRANKKNATPKWANLKKIAEIYKNCPHGMCVDHIIPIQSKIVCGLHCESNLQYLTRSDNSKKSNIMWPDMP